MHHMTPLSQQPQKIIFSDFDGTLVGSELTLSPRVKNAVKKWISAGNKFTIITGRTYSGILEKACQELQLIDPIAARGGSEVWDPTNNEIISAVFIKEESAKKIVQILTTHTIYFEVGKKEGVYAAEIEGVKKDPWKKYFPLTDLTYEGISKIRIIMAEGDTRDIDPLIHKEIILTFPDVHAIKAPNKFSIGYDITSEKATKYLAALEMMKQHGISQENTVGIGDSYNDYPLLSAAHTKIAMDGAPQELLDIADMVVPSVEEDGVAVAIERLMG
ncbi:Cof-type HAD-IIB family hydrolase [soil metagenome]